MTEFGLIDKIVGLCAALPDNGCEGIGDDCAVIPISESESLLLTQDMLVERIHFLRHATSPYDLGRKSLAVNLSDIAAMGATPMATLLSLSLPAEVMGDWVEEFMRGYRDLSLEHGVALIGGDTTASKEDITINITAIGRANRANIKRRSTAEVGDIIVTTGVLGGSGEGLNDILRGDLDTDMATLHRRPTPRIKEGEWLATHEEVHAMMDISDGVASDLLHILRASGVGAHIELSMVPKAGSLRNALCAGEDYELLFTCSATHFERLHEGYRSHFGTSLHPIGEIVAGEAMIEWLNHNEPQEEIFSGFVHY